MVKKNKYSVGDEVYCLILPIFYKYENQHRSYACHLIEEVFIKGVVERVEDDCYQILQIHDSEDIWRCLVSEEFISFDIEELYTKAQLILQDKYHEFIKNNT